MYVGKPLPCSENDRERGMDAFICYTVMTWLSLWIVDLPWVSRLTVNSYFDL